MRTRASSWSWNAYGGRWLCKGRCSSRQMVPDDVKRAWMEPSLYAFNDLLISVTSSHGFIPSDLCFVGFDIIRGQRKICDLYKRSCTGYILLVCVQASKHPDCFNAANSNVQIRGSYFGWYGILVAEVVTSLSVLTRKILRGIGGRTLFQSSLVNWLGLFAHRRPCTHILCIELKLVLLFWLRCNTFFITHTQ